MPSIQDAVDYIRQQDKILKKWSNEDLTREIYESISERAFYYSLDSEGKINGVVLGRIFGENLHIVGILAKPSAFKLFVRILLRDYKQFRLTAYRNGEFVEYKNPERFKLILCQENCLS